jgi:hypothetical protein
MSIQPSPAFKIEISHLNKKIAFGRRFKGEVGRDILAVKIALGLVKSIDDELQPGQSPISYDPNIPLDSQRWFNCSTGLGLDIRRASTFDSTLESSIASFQVQNQFLITSYLFEKFGIRSVIGEAESAEEKIVTQIDAARILFENEFGNLQEATLAVIHGWRPHSTISNDSYIHDKSRYSEQNPVVDVLPRMLMSDLISESYPQNFNNLVERQMVVPGSITNNNRDKLVQYFSNVSSQASAWIDVDFESDTTISTNIAYGSIDYYPVLTGDSKLFSAVKQVVSLLGEENQSSEIMTPEERAQAARRLIYPNPFTDPDPFIIDGVKMGFYDNTEFFISDLDNNVNLPNTNPETISVLEEKALIKILKYYGKPQVWNFLKSDQKFLEAYFPGYPSLPSPYHSGKYPTIFSVEQISQLEILGLNRFAPEVKKQNFHVITTSDVIESIPEQEKLDVTYWRAIDDFQGTEPLIKFVEFVTPSLRPGDTYRALFEINRAKLEEIKNGQEIVNIYGEPPSSPGFEIPTELDVCPDQNFDQSNRTFQEYRTHAIKRRKEIVKRLREAVLERSYRPSGAQVDLGEFGPFDLNSAFSGATGINLNSHNDYEFTKKVLSLAPELLESIGVVNSDIEALEEAIGQQEARQSGKSEELDVNSITMDIEEIRARAEMVSDDLRKAHETILRENIRFHEASSFDAATEASLLETYVSELIKSSGVSESAWKTTQITIRFQNVSVGRPGPQNGKIIISFNVGSKSIEAPQISSQRPRTMNYLAFLKQMTGGTFASGGNFASSFFDDSMGSCKELGLDFEKSLSIAFVGRYTSGLKVIAESGSFKESFVSWFKQEFEDPAMEWWDTSKENMESSTRNRFNEKQALRLFGETCKFVGRGNIFEKFFDRLDLASLLCDYLKCVKLPGFQFKAPNLSLPPLPEIPIIGWYAGLLEFLKEKFAEIALRILCTFARTIIDKVAFPFCQEQLEEFISAGSSASPVMNRALIDALTNTGITSKNNKKAKDFFDNSANILTPKELCYLLEGKRLDDASMHMLQKVAEANDIGEDLNSYEAIENFYGVIGSYINFDFCENLSQFDDLPNIQDCEDTRGLLQSIRNRLLSADPTITEEEINGVLNIAAENARSQEASLDAFQKDGFAGMMPDFFKLGSPDAVISEFPDFLKKELESTAETIFDSAKSNYQSALGRYVPAMIAEAPLSLNAYDEGYDAIQTLRFEAALQQLEDLAKQFPREPVDNTLQERAELTAFIESGAGTQEDFYREAWHPTNHLPDPNGLPAATQPNIDTQFAALHQLYQVEVVNGHLVHKRMFKLPRSNKIALESNIVSLNETIKYLTTRYNRIRSTGKKKRIAKERRRARAELKACSDALADINFEKLTVQPIKYDEYLEFVELAATTPADVAQPEFELVPFLASKDDLSNEANPSVDFSAGPDSEYEPPDIPAEFPAIEQIIFNNVDKAGLYSLNLDHYPSRRSYYNLNDAAKTKILSRVEIIANNEDFRGGGADPSLEEINAGTQRLQDRVNSLKDRIVEILNFRPSIIDSILLPGLKESLSRSTEQMIERTTGSGRIETENNSTKIHFASGSLYSPEISMTEYESGGDKDRFDIKITGDIFLNLLPAESKTFKFCEKLPTNPYVESSAQGLFAKREVFAGMISARIMSELNPSNPEQLQPSMQFRQEMSSEFFEKTTESIFEQIIDATSESRIFDRCYADPLDSRVSGKRIINTNCISNRFSLTDASILNFKEVILKDLTKEVIEQQVKPENDPVNSDFTKPTPFDLAVQKVSLTGFIKVCLIDALLKGGICFSIWDLEPIAGQEVYIKYLYEHVLRELNDNNSLKTRWPKIIEDATGIFNKFDALDKVVREEILKLPNFSKQVFQFNDMKRDFYNWHVDSFIPQYVLGETFSESNYVIPSTTLSEDEFYFVENKPSFIIEHYIKVYGEIKEIANTTLRIPDNQRAPSRNEGLILSLDQFYTLIERLRIEFAVNFESRINSIISESRITQNTRLVIVEANSDRSAQERGYNFRDFDSRLSEEDFYGNSFIKEFILNYSSPDELQRTSERTRSFRVKVTSEGEFADLYGEMETRVSDRIASAIPLVNVERDLDFEDCYSFDNYFEGNSFYHDIPSMMQNLYNHSDCVLLFEHIIPFRRIMSISTIFTTSILSAFNDMPSLFDSTKSQLANLVLLTFTAPDKRNNLLGITPDQMQATILDNYPSDSKDWDCFDFPGISADFWKDFISEIKKLALKLPSILFRGIAGTIDPAYKEMKAHYLNCDIDNLTWRGVRPAGTVDSKLVNGLYLGQNAAERANNAQRARGKYVPLLLGSLSDFGYTAYSLGSGNLTQFGNRLEKTISKLITYAYNGNAPFLDPSFYFKVPCLDFETRKKWAEYGKYDTGRFGRYGHPLSPLTAIALSLPQLEGDKTIKENNCAIAEDPNYCEEISRVVEPVILDRCTFEPDYERLSPNYGRWTPPSAEAGQIAEVTTREGSEEDYATNEMAQDYGYDSADDLGNTESKLLRRLWEIEKKPFTPVGIDTQGDLDYQSFSLYHMLYGIMRPLNTNSDRYLDSAKTFDKMKIAYLDWEIQVERVRSLENERIEIRDALNFQRLDWPQSEMYTWPPPFWKPDTEGMDLSEGYRRRILGPTGDTSIDFYSMDIFESAREYRLKYA